MGSFQSWFRAAPRSRTHASVFAVGQRVCVACAGDLLVIIDIRLWSGQAGFGVPRPRQRLARLRRRGPRIDELADASVYLAASLTRTALRAAGALHPGEGRLLLRRLVRDAGRDVVDGTFGRGLSDQEKADLIEYPESL